MLYDFTNTIPEFHNFTSSEKVSYFSHHIIFTHTNNKLVLNSKRQQYDDTIFKIKLHYSSTENYAAIL